MMESQKQEMKTSSQPSEVAKFYDGKTLFITGAGGFLGTVILETLLRCCPGIHRIFILLRPKKGVQPEDRKEDIFKKSIFHKIREKYPSVLNKVVVIPGDIAHNNLGMSSEDMSKVIQEVSIVFHCAAAISFIKPLSFILQQNLMGTNNIIELCRKLRKFEVLAYTSTAFSNCNHRYIEEKIYKLPFTAEEVIKAFKTVGEEEVMKMFSKCEPKFPNFYTFTKSLSESLLQEKAADLPVLIVRPSIIICCMNGILPGYIEDGTGLTILSIGVGKGFIRVLRCDPELHSNQIPGDVVANTHIVGAYRQIVDNLPSPFVYNSVANASKQWTWKYFTNHLLKMVYKHPLPNCFQQPSLTICKNNVAYFLCILFDHYVPAFVIDILLWVTGRKPRLLKLYRFYEKNMETMKYFTLNEWNLESKNFDSLGDKLNAKDKELFNVELTEDFNMEYLSGVLLTGGPMYQKDYDDGKKLQPKYVPLYLTLLIKWAVLGGLASAFYVALF